MLIGIALGGLVLVWSTMSVFSWGTGQTALALVLCGLVQAEFVRYRARRADSPGVSTVAVWIIGAVLTLPLAGVLVVSAVLHAHDLHRGPQGRRYLRRVLASTGGATVAWLVLSILNWSVPVEAISTPAVLTAGIAGLVYLTAIDGLSLLRAAQRLVLGGRTVVGGHGASTSYGATLTALGVLLGLFAQFSVVAIPLILLPVAYVQRAERARALRYAAAHDPKTQLWNHAAWQTLSNAALTSHRAPTHAAVLMVDLDHFKRLNDTYGHHAGDDVLTSVAHVLQTTTRQNDIVARFGGEEFSILLPDVTEDEALQAAERIRHQIGTLTVITTNLHGRPTSISGITASIGVATTHHADTNVDDLLVNADRRLYQAKEGGRNRVCGPVLAAAA